MGYPLLATCQCFSVVTNEYGKGMSPFTSGTPKSGALGAERSHVQRSWLGIPLITLLRPSSPRPETQVRAVCLPLFSLLRKLAFIPYLALF